MPFLSGTYPKERGREKEREGGARRNEERRKTEERAEARDRAEPENGKGVRGDGVRARARVCAARERGGGENTAGEAA